ncbi:MAG: beta-galactosidase, partial [Myxococcota bacterium]
QETTLDVHDNNASWPNAGYPHDYVEGENNMNEEWFGLAAKGPNDETGLFPVYPRSAYYLLREAFQLDPYAPSTTQSRIRTHFAQLSPKKFSGAYERDIIAAKVGLLERFSITDARLKFETYTTGGARLQEADRTEPRFDHMESLFLGVGVTPYSKLSGKVVVNVLGNVPNNRIDDIFFEKRGAPRSLIDSTGEEFQLDGVERVKLYQAEFTWDEDWFGLEGYYRVGHFHWGYEGDFFGLYPEAHYLDDVDRYNANAPYGMVFEGRKALKGIKIAVGPELYWGANPQVIVKYQRKVSDTFNFTLMHHEDIAGQSDIVSSAAIPTQLNRRSTLHLDFNFGAVRLEMGGIVAGTPRLGDRFVAARESDGGGYINSGNDFFEDKIQWVDTLGGKAKLSMDFGAVKWFVQGAYKGLVADGGPDGVVTYSGFSLKEDGRGNQYNVLTGLTYNIGNFQIAPGFLFQKPLEGALPGVGDYFNPGSGNYYEGIRPRNYRDDPFAVLGNRETIGFELILAWDPTPATWLWAWDNEIVEDAVFAGSLDFVYRIHRSIRDVNIGFNEFGPFAFPGSPPAQDVWDVKARMLFRLPHDVRLRTLLYAGQGEARGDDERLITRYGLDARLTVSRFALDVMLKIDDWGPYDFHKDFNLTYPVQMGLDASWGVVAPRWLGRLYGKFGVAFQYRTLDEHSPRYRTTATSHGNEWELRTYVDISL